VRNDGRGGTADKAGATAAPGRAGGMVSIGPVTAACVAAGVIAVLLIGGMPSSAGAAPSAPPHSAVAPASPSATASPSAAARSASPSGPASPVRELVDVSLVAKPKTVFIHQNDEHMCASAAVQITSAILGADIPMTAAFQNAIAGRLDTASTPADSRNGGAGPDGMAIVIGDLSGVPYEVRTSETRAEALRDAAAAISRTGKPVVLLAWYGAHAWVMTGYMADADPALFPDAALAGVRIMDPWFPWASSIWGQSAAPGVLHTMDDMARNYRPWSRPEGRYPGRDGRFVWIAPVESPAP
jgi:hypothetical protein